MIQHISRAIDDTEVYIREKTHYWSLLLTLVGVAVLVNFYRAEFDIEQMYIMIFGTSAVLLYVLGFRCIRKTHVGDETTAREKYEHNVETWWSCVLSVLTFALLAYMIDIIVFWKLELHPIVSVLFAFCAGITLGLFGLRLLLLWNELNTT